MRHGDGLLLPLVLVLLAAKVAPARIRSTTSSDAARLGKNPEHHWQVARDAAAPQTTAATKQIVPAANVAGIAGKASFLDKFKQGLEYVTGDLAKQGCPELAFTVPCLMALHPHQVMVTGVAGSTIKDGMIEMVWDLQTYEVGMQIGGAVSFGSNFLRAAELAVEAGVAYKGKGSGDPIEGPGVWGLSADLSGSFLAEVSATLTVDAKVETLPNGKPDLTTLRPEWDAGKSLAFGIGVDISVPTGVQFNVGLEYVTPLWAVHCTEYFDKLAPYCQAAMIAFMPPQVTPPVRIAIMVKFMREWCPTQTGSKLCAETKKLENPNFLELEEVEGERGQEDEGGVLAVNFIQVGQGQRLQVRRRARGHDMLGAGSTWEEVLHVWAAFGTKMADKLKMAIKISKEAREFSSRVMLGFNHMLRDAKAEVNKFLSENVGPRLDAVRAGFGDVKPEDLPDHVIPIPSGRGVFVKVKDCGPLGTTPKLEAPYWTCAPEGADIEDEGLTTEVGQHEGPQPDRFYWDHNDDETKAGWGIFFAGATNSKCVQCYLRERHTFGHSLRFGADEDFDNSVFFKVCGGSKVTWTPHKVHGDLATTRGSECLTLYSFQG
jgi:hypothetical protein